MEIPGLLTFGGLHDFRDPVGTPEELVRLFLTDLTALHGSLRGYVTGRPGVTDATVGALRGPLLDGRPRPQLRPVPGSGRSPAS
ncbi:hypothetical protein ACFWBV_27940 [Streptomyces sp. NPDC060030]|uniref:hypothetical protein n=1 Tax=Streptomyces sp. NPDC060030 TaxID=3347042 RepID=UPI00368C9672